MSELAGQQEIDLTLPIPTTAAVDPQQQQVPEHTEQPQAQEQSHVI
jgi:hypothetical protein